MTNDRMMLIPELLMPAFGNTVKEGLKRTTIWSTYYFTVNKSYYHNLTDLLAFSEIPLLPPLLAVSMTLHQGLMGEWPSDNGKTVRQRTVTETGDYEIRQTRHTSVEHVSEWRTNRRETTV